MIINSDDKEVAPEYLLWKYVAQERKISDYLLTKN